MEYTVPQIDQVSDWKGRHRLPTLVSGRWSDYVLKEPGLDEGAVDWLVKRNVGRVCGDSPSLEQNFVRHEQWNSLRHDVFRGGEVARERFPRPAHTRPCLMSDIYVILDD